MSELATTPTSAGPASGSSPQAVEPTAATEPRTSAQAQTPGAAGSAQAPAGPPPQSPAVSLAASLAQVLEGSRLRGVIIGADPTNRPLLRTESGTFVLDSDEPLPPNTRLTLRVLSTATVIRAMLLTRNERAIHPPRELTLTLTGVKGPPPTIVGGAPRPENEAPTGPLPARALRPGSELTAIVLRPPRGSAAAAQRVSGSGLPGGSSPAPAPGTTLLLRTVASAPLAAAPPASGTTPPAPNQPTPLQDAARPTGAAQPRSGQPGPGHSGAVRSAQDPAKPRQSGRAMSRATAQSEPTPARSASPSGSLPRAVNPSAAAPASTPVAGVGGAGKAPAPASGAAATTAATTGLRPFAAPVGGRVVAPGTAPAPASAAAGAAASAPSAPAASAAPEAPAAPVAVPAKALVAIAVGPAPEGGLLVRTPLGRMVLQTLELVAPGTRLTFEVLGSRPPEALPGAGAVTGATKRGSLAALSGQWPALKEALEAVASVDPALARHLVNNVLPAPTARLPSSVLFFLAAVRLGDIGGWLGREASQILERAGRGRLLRQLGDDLARIGRFAEERERGDWRTFALPFHDGGELHQIWLLTRQHRHDEDGEEGAADGGLRFLVELDLSRLGPLQLDGLVRGSRFDLIVRTKEPLAAEMRRDILGIFDDGLAASGLTGAIIFHTEPAFALSALDVVAGRDGQSDGIVV